MVFVLPELATVTFIFKVASNRKMRLGLDLDADIRYYYPQQINDFSHHFSKTVVRCYFTYKIHTSMPELPLKTFFKTIAK